MPYGTALDLQIILCALNPYCLSSSPLAPCADHSCPVSSTATVEKTKVEFSLKHMGPMFISTALGSSLVFLKPSISNASEPFTDTDVATAMWFSLSFLPKLVLVLIIDR